MSDLNDPRVLFAAERTLLAWNRTGLSLIAFGFLVERSGLVLGELETVRTPDTSALTLLIGLGFIVLGVICALYSSRQYLTMLKTLRPPEIPAGYRTWGGLAINVAVAVLGLCLAAALLPGYF